MTEILVLRCPHHPAYTGAKEREDPDTGCRRVWAMRKTGGWLVGTFTVIAEPNELGA